MSATDSLTMQVTDSTFAADVEQAQGLVLVDFWATWCGPCQIVAPVLEQLATEYTGKIKVAKVDVDANQQTSMKFNIRSIPAILFFKGGKHVDTVIGAVPKSVIASKIQQHI
ncbi:MAG: thioredoxin [Gemmatimonadota bacterium]